MNNERDVTFETLSRYVQNRRDNRERERETISIENESLTSPDTVGLSWIFLEQATCTTLAHFKPARCVHKLRENLQSLGISLEQGQNHKQDTMGLRLRDIYGKPLKMRGEV